MVLMSAYQLTNVFTVSLSFITMVAVVLCEKEKETSNCQSIRKDVDWWKKTIVYQIYPLSFQDSNGDGVGDLQGIISRLDHLSYLNIGTIWLNPIYKSPMKDHGYDIQDFTDIDPVFGTLADFDRLIAEAHSRDIYVLMDFIPNHSSNLHKWFVESRKGGESNPYSDYYVWTDGKRLENGTRVPPNNWVSFFGGSAWTWDDVRGQFFFHQYAVEQPDLNTRNPRVLEELKNTLQFWLDRGVDGFRIDAVGAMFESTNLELDSPRSFLPNVQPHEKLYFNHIYTKDLPEIHDVIADWQKLFDEYDRKNGGHTLMVTEVYTSEVETMKYYHSGADMPFNFNFVRENLKTCDGICFQQNIDGWINAMPAGKWPNFVLGNHDKPRVSARKGTEYVDALNVLLLTLPGTPTTYYGEELGMNVIEVSYEDTKDPKGINLGPKHYKSRSRDPCRAPMQWSNDKNGGFSSTSNKTWLPVHPDYKTRNVQSQRTQQGSSLHIYRKAAEVRQRREFQTSDLTYVVVNNNILSYMRYIRDSPKSALFLVALNVGSVSSTDNYIVKVSGLQFENAVVLLDTESVDETGRYISLKSLTLHVGQAVVLQLSGSPGHNEL